MSDKLLTRGKTEFGAFEAALSTLLFVILNVLFMDSYVAIIKSLGYVTNIGILVAQFLVEALFGVAAVLVAIFCKTNIIKAAGMNKKISVNMVIYGLLIAFCSIIFFASLTSSFLEFLSLVGYKSSSSSMAVNDFGSYFGYVIAACVTPAICEELLFRGTIQAGLKKFGKWISIISASLIFMLMHGGPEQTVHQFIVGVIVGLLFYETGNLWLGVIVHFFNNFISITELFVYNLMVKPSQSDIIDSSTEALEISASQAWSNFATNLFFAIILACIGYLLVRFLMKKMIEEDKKINGQKVQFANIGETEQVIMVDGKEVKLNISISENEEPVINANQDSESEEGIFEKHEKKKVDIKTILCFAIPILWLVYVWVAEFIAGLGG